MHVEVRVEGRAGSCGGDSAVGVQQAPGSRDSGAWYVHSFCSAWGCPAHSLFGPRRPRETAGFSEPLSCQPPELTK